MEKKKPTLDDIKVLNDLVVDSEYEDLWKKFDELILDEELKLAINNNKANIKVIKNKELSSISSEEDEKKVRISLFKIINEIEKSISNTDIPPTLPSPDYFSSIKNNFLLTRQNIPFKVIKQEIRKIGTSISRMLHLLIEIAGKYKRELKVFLKLFIVVTILALVLNYWPQRKYTANFKWDSKTIKKPVVTYAGQLVENYNDNEGVILNKIKGVTELYVNYGNICYKCIIQGQDGVDHTFDLSNAENPEKEKCKVVACAQVKRQ